LAEGVNIVNWLNQDKIYVKYKSSCINLKAKFQRSKISFPNVQLINL